MPNFMLIIRNSDEVITNYSPEEYQKLLEKFMKWSESLEKAGKWRGGEKLRDGANRLVYQKGDQIVVDGPFAETKESISGFFLIEAANIEEAAEQAKSCPSLPIGAAVEVRELERK